MVEPVFAAAARSAARRTSDSTAPLCRAGVDADSAHRAARSRRGLQNAIARAQIVADGPMSARHPGLFPSPPAVVDGAQRRPARPAPSPKRSQTSRSA
jgi:hypothetical protein